ncbi:hypothetical protein, partial [Athalassotoga sp.]|uniref:hypothetical protein n=1 Tax=Athalassotoga sp. TaxID=2022597 RepID=UPI003D07B7A6
NMVSTLFILGINKPALFTFLFLNKDKKLLLMRERIINQSPKMQVFDRFKFNSSYLKGGDEYVLGYVVDGRLLALRSIEYKDWIYDFSKNIL